LTALPRFAIIFLTSKITMIIRETTIQKLLNNQIQFFGFFFKLSPGD